MNWGLDAEFEIPTELSRTNYEVVHFRATPPHGRARSSIFFVANFDRLGRYGILEQPSRPNGSDTLTAARRRRASRKAFVCSCAVFRSVATRCWQCFCCWLFNGGLPLLFPSACLLSVEYMTSFESYVSSIIHVVGSTLIGCTGNKCKM